ncbi:hypothetical protein HPB50_023906 [Hyalomma asiaticum]|uniref:Uncharacterized protein n=1 Tax=Hyalomma asiaticum TaxID=266040 RepID=A0ACB7SYP9_HYAAI|nr:hypothetical protein HPB50_023906 [Hyalomma asiaticum]
MAALAGAASRKRSGLQSGAYSDDTSVYSLSSEDCCDYDLQLVRSCKAKRRNKRPYIIRQVASEIHSEVRGQYNYFSARTRYTSNLRWLNRQSVSNSRSGGTE